MRPHSVGVLSSCAMRFSVMRWLIFIGLGCALGSMQVRAQQWTVRDSLWLQRVLSGQDTVRLDPDVKRAIERGELINAEPVGTPQLAPKVDPPITKDFSEYIGTDQNPHRKVPLNKLPPQVFWHHNPRFKGLPPVYESIQEELKRNPPTGPAAMASFDAAEATSKKARTHKKNAKRSSTWRNYNNLPTPDVISKRKMFEKQQAEKARKDTIATH